MDAKQELQKDNFLNNLMRAKQLVEFENEKQKEKTQNAINLLKSCNGKDLFETTAKTVKDLKNYTVPKLDVSYCSLNIAFLKEIGITLEEIYTDLLVSNSSANIILVKYYVDQRNSCIIFVKHLFKHIRLYSQNKKTDLLTYAFVNTKNAIYYYDGLSNCKLLKSFNTNMGISHARDLIKNKVFKIKSPAKRTFKISFDNNATFVEKPISDIHLIIKHLVDILIGQYENSDIPKSSNIHIKTTFIGTLDKPVDVQYNIEVNYKYTGIIQTTEKLSEYEVLLYFVDFPEKKVSAHFYLSESEKKQSFILTDNFLENIVLETIDEKIKLHYNYKNFYQRYFLEKSSYKRDKSGFRKLAQTIYQNATIHSTFIECPKLKNSFGRIYLEYFKLDSRNICRRFSFKQICKCKFKYDGKSFIQSSIYSVIYNNVTYLIEVYTSYSAYYYSDSSVTVYLPAFSVNDIGLKIFKPFTKEEIDKFINSNSDNELPRKCFYYSHNQFGSLVIPRDKHLYSDSWKELFTDFVIETGVNRENYEITSTKIDTIYNSLLNCIVESRNEDSKFNFSVEYPFGFGDDEDSETTRYPLISDNLKYGYYFDDGFHVISVNSPLRNNCNYSYSSGDKLMCINFDTELPYYKKTLYELFNKYSNYCSRDSKIEPSHWGTSFSKFDLWDCCIKFLLRIPCEDLFK